MKKTKFSDYKNDGSNWITLTTGEFYPDILIDACLLYQPVLEMFAQFLKVSESSERLFMFTTEIRQPWMRIQLARVFRKYVSPNTPVEMLKRKSDAKKICEKFGKGFRPVQEVQKAFLSRPMPDEALCAILWEYKDRGTKGYDLTERMFDQFRSMFPELTITGPERAGRDILLGEVFEDYPHPKRPADFVLKLGHDILAVGFARYDSDRGGSQEDDRTGGYKNAADEVLGYTKSHGLKTKVIFINDGPGLLLGSMWRDYSEIEERHEDQIIVLTLRMIPERLTMEWLLS
jgi:hypothetical protein